MADPKKTLEIKKRQRTENWLEVDKVLLKELVKERVRCIENKNSDSNNNKKKQNAWLDLQHNFNSMCNGIHRSLPQLKAQWTTLKINAKKEKSLARQSQIKTGGGPPPIISDAKADDISSWLPYELSTDTNEFDSDSLNRTKPNSQDTSDLYQPDAPDEAFMDLSLPGTSAEPTPSGTHSPSFIDLSQLGIPSEEPLLVVVTHTQYQDFGKPAQPATASKVPPPESYSEHFVDLPKPGKAVEEPEHITQNDKKKSNKSVLIKNKKVLKKKANDISEAQREQVAVIAENEIRCRKELHEVQMENEKMITINLSLKFEILQEKLKFYKRQNEE